MESLSWLLWSGCIRSGFYAEALSQSYSLIQFHDRTQRESQDYAVKVETVMNVIDAVVVIVVDVFDRGGVCVVRDLCVYIYLSHSLTHSHTSTVTVIVMVSSIF